MCNLKNDQSIVITEADKGSAVVIWIKRITLWRQKNNFLVKKPMKKFQVTHLFSSKLFMILSKKFEKEEAFLVIFQIIVMQKILSLADSIYCLKFIRMYDIPGRSVISNCGFCTENISAFLDHHLKLIAMQVKSYVKDTNDFLKKLRDLRDLPEESIICTTDVVGLYPSIPN